VKEIYDSGLHHPLVAYLVAAAFALYFARQLPFLYGYVVFFLFEIVADATATGAWSPIALGTTGYTIASVVFIVLGDFRYFFLAERMSRLDEDATGPLLFALVVSLVVPLITGVMTRTIPIMADTRVLYMVYETALGVIVLALDRTRFRRANVPEDVRAFVHRVSMLFATLYFGWAICDVLIFTGLELGHVLRIVPNVLYYGAFVPFVYLAAPASLKAFPARAASAS
jgi:hypothetical protein